MPCRAIFCPTCAYPMGYAASHRRVRVFCSGFCEQYDPGIRGARNTVMAVLRTECRLTDQQIAAGYLLSRQAVSTVLRRRSIKCEGEGKQ